MTSSESEGQPPPRKRSRTSGNGEESGKKARGRPRVDTQDETAADRRRTQIRLAQRAYRQRKETTIASLKRQNTELQSIIEQMNKAFLHFNDSAFKLGLLQWSPSLANELKEATEVFVALAKSASEGGSHEDEENSEVPLDPATELHNAAAASRTAIEGSLSKTSPIPAPTHTDVGWGYAASAEESPPPTNAASSRKGSQQHSVFFPPFQSATQSSLVKTRRAFAAGQIWDRTITQPSSTPQQLPFGLIDLIGTEEIHQYASTSSNPQVFSVNIPTPKATPPLTRLSTPPLLPRLNKKTLSSPWTYSHDETTFARRLTRAALETGFHLLSAASIRPAALNYVFRLSLPYMSLGNLRERFKMLLARGVHEDLDCWETPFIHLGGAGTHYPRKDAEGNVIPIPNSWTVRSIGPLPAKLMRAENATDPTQSHDLAIDLTGFEGEWFDAYDVQGYLEEEKGCHIDPKDSFAEVLIEVEEEANDTEFGSIMHSRGANFNLDLSDTRRTSNYTSNSPDLSYSSSTTESSSAKSTPDNDLLFNRSDAPFGLDMGMNLPVSNSFSFDISKLGEIDPSTLFDQPLGLDLAPGFETGINTGLNTGTFDDIANLGLDMMGQVVGQMPAVKRKTKKTAWVDVSKLIDEIIKHGVCLGRAPGFRRKDVDMAFQASLIMAF